MPRAYFVIEELMPPHNPLSVDTGIVTFFSPGVASVHADVFSHFSFDTLPGMSPRNCTSGLTTPRDCSMRDLAVRIFEAATIFMAEVIFLIFSTDFIRVFTARSDAWRTCSDRVILSNTPSTAKVSQTGVPTNCRSRSSTPRRSQLAKRTSFPIRSPAQRSARRSAQTCAKPFPP